MTRMTTATLVARTRTLRSQLDMLHVGHLCFGVFLAGQFFFCKCSMKKSKHFNEGTKISIFEP